MICPPMRWTAQPRWFERITAPLAVAGEKMMNVLEDSLCAVRPLAHLPAEADAAIRPGCMTRSMQDGQQRAQRHVGPAELEIEISHHVVQGRAHGARTVERRPGRSVFRRRLAVRTKALRQPGVLGRRKVDSRVAHAERAGDDAGVELILGRVLATDDGAREQAEAEVGVEELFARRPGQLVVADEPPHDVRRQRRCEASHHPRQA
jgi:hypothetical protein